MIAATATVPLSSRFVVKSEVPLLQRRDHPPGPDASGQRRLCHAQGTGPSTGSDRLLRLLFAGVSLRVTPRLYSGFTSEAERAGLMIATACIYVEEVVLPISATVGLWT
jgi:hypothetical protein